MNENDLELATRPLTIPKMLQTAEEAQRWRALAYYARMQRAARIRVVCAFVLGLALGAGGVWWLT